MLNKIMSAALIAGLMAISAPIGAYAEEAPAAEAPAAEAPAAAAPADAAPTTKEDCEKVEGMTWDEANKTCTKAE